MARSAMRRLRVWLAVAGMMVALAGVLVPVVLAMRAGRGNGASPTHVRVSSAPASGASGAMCPSWRIVSSPSPGTFVNELASVATVSASDAWTVGTTSDTNIPHTLAEHWNGAAWSVVATPDGGSSGSYLRSVATAASNDVWAAGYSIVSANINRALIERWNGSVWSVVSSPNVGGTGVNNQLNGIAAVSSSVAWAVGASGSAALIEQWNGSTWTVVTPPSVNASTSSLTAVAVLSPNDVVAVGTQQLATGGSKTLIEQWNGSAWSVIPSPNVGTLGNFLTSISALSASDLWVGGYYNDGSANSPVYQALAEHWNGAAWSVVATPSLSDSTNMFLGIAAVSATSVWAVGLLQGTAGDITLAEHWNGSAWQHVLTPNLAGGETTLASVVAVAGGNIIAVGNGMLAPPSATEGTAVEVYPRIAPANATSLSGATACP